MYLIKNNDTEPRKFRDRSSGRTVVIPPGKTVKTKKKPEESEFFEITEEKIKPKKEAIKDDSSSN